MGVTESPSSQLRRGVLEFCTLALIEAGPTYGLQVSRQLSEQHLLESEGTLYPLLTRLRRRGLVDTDWAQSPSGPHRRYYRLTSDGADALAQFRTEWTSFSAAVDRVMGATRDT